MNWIHPFFLFGLAAIAAPILLHLFGRKPARVIDLPTIELLRRALEARRKRSRLKEIILVLLRVSFVAAITLALARPLVSKSGRTVETHTPKDIVLLLDNSLSMATREGNETWMDRAKGRANSIVGSLGTQGRAMILPLVESGLVTRGFTDDRTVLRQVISSISTTRTAGDFFKRLEAVTLQSRDRSVPVEGWVITDGTARPWRDRLALSGLSGLHIIDVSEGRSPKNRTLVEALATDHWKEDQPTAEIEARIRSNDGRADRVQVEVLRNGVSLDRQFVDLAPGTEGFAKFSIPYAEAQQDLIVRLEPDALVEDNSRTLSVVRPRPNRIFILNGRPSPDPREDAVAPFRSALMQQGRGGEYEAEDISVERLDRLETDSHLLLVLADTADLSRARVDRLQKFVAQGGSLLVSLGESYVSQEVNRPIEQLFPARLRVARSSEGAAPFLLAPPSDSSSPFSFLSRRWENWLGNASFRRIFLTEPAAAEQIVLRFRDGTPLLLMSKNEQGKVALWLSSLGAEWNDLPLAPGYPALVRTWVTTLLLSAEKEPKVTPNEEDPTESDLARWNTKEIEGRLDPLKVVWEKGSSVTHSTSAARFVSEEKSGLLARLALFLLIVESFFAGRLSLRFLWKRRAAAVFVFASLAASSNAHALGERSRIEIARVRVAGQSAPQLHPLSYLLQKMSVMTNVDVASDLVDVNLSDARLSDYPFLYWSGDRAFSLPPQADLDRLRRHLTSGGFLVFDQASAGSLEPSARALVTALFPEKTLRPLTSEHSVFRSYFLIKRASGRMGAAVPLGVDIGSRTAILFFPGDLAGALEQDATGRFVFDLPGGEEQRTEALRFGVNILLYALTLDYKQDQIHLPFILNRRRS